MWHTLPNGTQVWYNTSQYFVNITNSTSPVSALNQGVNAALPWFWPLFPFILYIMLMSIYSDSPTGGKLYMIAALVFVMSAFMAMGGYLLDAVINFVIFAGAFFITNHFKNT